MKTGCQYLSDVSIMKRAWARKYANSTLVSIILLVLLADCSSSPLTQAYHHQSVAMLDEWFQHWHDAVLPVSAQELAQQSDTVKAVYAMFQTIFNPLDYTQLGARWGPNEYNRAIRYAIIQNSVRYRIVDSLPMDTIPPRSYKMETRSSGTIRGFRPDVNPEGLIRVYLVEPYEPSLSSFLLEDDPDPRAGTIPYPRSQFLRPYLVVQPEDWVWQWQLPTPPAIAFITFDQTLHRALVNCSLNDYAVVDLLMELRGEQWVVVDSQIGSMMG